MAPSAADVAASATDKSMTNTSAVQVPVDLPATAAADTPDQGDDGRGVATSTPGSSMGSFRVQLDNFDGPFDLLLQLISAQKLDITEISLHQVTDDFIAHIRAAGSDWDLGQATEFLVVAATLLDLKAARLLPGSDDDMELDFGLLESRDLLFARLLAYRAYQQVAELFVEMAAHALRRFPRAVTLEDRYLDVLPEVKIGVDAQGLAAIAQQVFSPKPPPPQVATAHIHRSPESVALHTAAMIALLKDAQQLTFAQLVAQCSTTMQIVARFLGLLNLYRAQAVRFDQEEPLGGLTVAWTNEADAASLATLAASEPEDVV